MKDSISHIHSSSCPALKPGDQVAVLAPASVVKTEFVAGAAKWIEQHGWQSVLIPDINMGTPCGSYADTEQNRVKYLSSALLNPEIKAVLCARGGYGCVQLLEGLSKIPIRNLNKWLIGFSDISVLHAFFNSKGVCGIHGPMAKHLTLHPDDESSRRLADILNGNTLTPISIASHLYNVCGSASGILEGGNLAVLDGLACTDYDILHISDTDLSDKILFFEDIAEPIYKIERILWRLHLSGSLQRAKGLIFGQFTEYPHPDRNFNSMEDMIHTLLKKFGFYDKEAKVPVVFDFPTGHVDRNLPLIEGAFSTLKVTEHETIFTQQLL